MPEVVMPRLSDSMEEGRILKWLKADGDAVAPGDELVEIETDKATVTYEAEGEGALEIVAQEGETLPVGAVIARLGEAVSAPGASGNGAPAQEARQPAAAAEPIGAAEPVAPAEPGAAATEAKASPIARRIARERGVDLAAIAGSGPGGRIVRADVEAPGEQPAAPAAAPPPATAAEAGTAKGEVTVVEPTRTQRVIARRMAESKATIPHFSISTEVDMERCVALRAELKQLGGDGVPSFNDMVVRACALALREHPKANGSYRDGKFAFHSRVNVGVAVAAEGSLVVPTVFDADRKGLRAIAAETRVLAERVRAGVITPPELGGGTFTVSNLGMFGITQFEAVVNPPQAAILAVGQMRQVPVVADGEVVVRHRLTATLACDHRILYGAEAAQFLARVRELLEQPLALAL